MITITHLTMIYRNVFCSNSSSLSPSVNSPLSSSSSFSYVLLARSKCRTAIPIAIYRQLCTVNCTPSPLLIALLKACVSSSPAYGPRLSPNKYSDSRWSSALLNGRIYIKYYANTWLTLLGKNRMI